jgi:hypothetical protein
MNFCFKLHKSCSIIFPKECFICGKLPDRKYSIRRFQFTEVGYAIIFKYSRMKIDAPVCYEHFNKITYLKFLFWITIFVGGILFFIMENGINYLVLGGIISTFLGKKYFNMKNSFKIYSIDGDGYIVYSSNREDYILKLCELNGSDIFMRHFLTGADY